MPVLFLLELLKIYTQLVSEMFTNHDQGKRFNSVQYRRDLSIKLKSETAMTSFLLLPLFNMDIQIHLANSFCSDEPS